MRKFTAIAFSSFLFFIAPTKPCEAFEVNISHEDVNDAAELEYRTNLPDETLVTLCVSDGSGTVMCEGRTVVSGGLITDATTNGCLQKLKPGSYLLEIQTEYAQFQPEQVRSVIGENGEYLHGQLVMKRMMGTRVWMTQPLAIEAGGRLRCRLN